MLTPALEKQRRELFAHTLDGMESRLGGVKEPGATFQALRWGMNELDRTLAETPAKVRATVACRAGCGWCCSVPVDGCCLRQNFSGAGRLPQGLVCHPSRCRRW